MTRKCKSCGLPFVPTRPLQPTCEAFACKLSYAEKVAAKAAEKRRKAERAAIKVRKEKAKRPQDLKAEAQAVVNRYVRLRDKDKPCISCGRPATWQGQWHASHFKSIGANSFLRFHLWNIHKSCSICNHHLSGNIGEYARRLPERIGADRYQWLLTAPRVRKYDAYYIKRLISVVNKRIRRFL